MIDQDFSQVVSGYQILLADEAQIAALEPVFEAMYDHFYKANGVTTLPKNGFKNWMVGYGRARLISRTVFICYDQGKCIGMVEGQIKIGGAMSDLGKLGHIAHLYVSPEYRNKGLASTLYRIQESWFLSKNANNVTLDVVCGNKEGTAFWSSLGFKASFVNMLKPIEPR